MTLAPISRPAPLGDAEFLAMLHTQAASVADVTGITWVKHRTAIQITVTDVPEQAALTEHLFGTTHPLGHWRLHHVGVSDEDARRVDVIVAVGGAR